jgi:hypothetical protein
MFSWYNLFYSDDVDCWSRESFLVDILYVPTIASCHRREAAQEGVR